MIVAFGDSATEDLYHNRPTARARRFPGDIIAAALRKLDALNAATNLEELAVIPGTRLEKLKGKLQDYFSIRVNNQWRIRFRWIKGSAHEVSLTDYH